jgi:hypothetical protein
MTHLRHRAGRGGEWVEFFEEGVEGHDVHSSAPKGRFIPAQGNALGIGFNNGWSPEGASHTGTSFARATMGRPFRALGLVGLSFLGRCPRLAYFAPLGLEK